MPLEEARNKACAAEAIRPSFTCTQVAELCIVLASVRATQAITVLPPGLDLTAFSAVEGC